MDYNSHVSTWMWKVSAPVILILGNIGNLLTIIVLTRQPRRCATSLYLIALAVSDLVVIDVGLVRLWIIHIAAVDVRLTADATCRIHWFLVYSSTEISSWLLVSVTLEQTVSIIWPHRVRAICRPQSARYVIAVIVTSIFVLCAHLLYGVRLHTSGATSAGNQTIALSIDMGDLEKSDQGKAEINTTLVCDVFGGSDVTYQYFFEFVFPWIDLLVYGLIPTVAMSVSDVMIIQKVFASKRMRSNMARASSGKASVKDKSASILVMLVTLNVVFVISTTPLCLFIISFPYWIDPQQGMTETQQLLGTCFSMLLYLKHSINFMLYAMVGSNFRTKMINVLKC